jgi:hypothetical protein
MGEVVEFPVTPKPKPKGMCCFWKCTNLATHALEVIEEQNVLTKADFLAVVAGLNSRSYKPQYKFFCYEHFPK